MLSYTKPTLTCCVQPDLASVCFCLWPPAECAYVRGACGCLCGNVCVCVSSTHLMGSISCFTARSQTDGAGTHTRIHRHTMDRDYWSMDSKTYVHIKMFKKKKKISLEQVQMGTKTQRSCLWHTHTCTQSISHISHLLHSRSSLAGLKWIRG